jgi:hypothetical protein
LHYLAWCSKPRKIRGFLMVSVRPLRVHAFSCVRLLRRFLRRFFFRFGRRMFFGSVTGNRPLEVGVGHVNVVPHRNGLRVAQPLRHNRQRELSGQVRFATRPHRMPQAGPRFQAGTTNNLFQRGPQVGIRPAAGALCPLAVLFGGYILSPFRRRVPGRFQVRPDSGE